MGFKQGPAIVLCSLIALTIVPFGSPVKVVGWKYYFTIILPEQAVLVDAYGMKRLNKH